MSNEVYKTQKASDLLFSLWTSEVSDRDCSDMNEVLKIFDFSTRNLPTLIYLSVPYLQHMSFRTLALQSGVHKNDACSKSAMRFNGATTTTRTGEREGEHEWKANE